MDTLHPSDSLFAVLAFAGIRQRDIARFLGVGKSLVSQWRSGSKPMPDHHHKTLWDWAEASYWTEWSRTKDQGAAAERRLQEFADLLDAAKAERNPSEWYYRLAMDTSALWRLVNGDEGMRLEQMQDVQRIEELGRRVVAAARLIKAQLAAREREKLQDSLGQCNG